MTFADASRAATRRTVLVVDDSLDTRMVARLVLETAGYDIVEAQDGVEAAEALGAGERPSVILLDLRMPNMDGYGFLRWLDDHPEYAELPVVVFSAHLEALHEGDLPVSAAPTFLMKPFKPEQLLRVISDVQGTGSEGPTR